MWQRPGMKPLLAMTFAGFTGYAVLLPLVPLWAVHGGADSGQAGLVNGTLLLVTVLTQLSVPAALRRWGWGPVLTVGLVMLGAPAALFVLTDRLGPVLALSAARGVGFGILTVTGVSAVAALVAPRRRGEAIGAYGLAVTLPNVVLLPLGPLFAEKIGFVPVLLLGAVPLLGVPAALRVARVLHEVAPDLVAADPAASTDPVSFRSLYLPLLPPMFLLLWVTLAGGALITFAPQMIEGSLLATASLFVMGLVGALARWRVGVLADRFGARRFLAPLLVATAFGVALVAWGIGEPGGERTVALLLGALLLGLGYGALQNLTLVVSFAAVGRRHHNQASTAWNMGFDLGTAIGSVAVGAIAVQTSFSAAMWVVAGLAVLVLPLVAGVKETRPGH